jgi:hypothetical protein
MLRRLTTAATILGLALAAASAAPAATAARCGPGTVKGIAWVTGGPSGVGSLTSGWTGAAALFGYRWNCSGGAVQVRKPDAEPPGFDVRFLGNPGRVAIATAAGGPAAASVTRNADGSFHVVIAGTASGSFTTRQDVAFVVIVV